MFLPLMKYVSVSLPVGNSAQICRAKGTFGEQDSGCEQVKKNNKLRLFSCWDLFVMFFVWFYLHIYTYISRPVQSGLAARSLFFGGKSLFLFLGALGSDSFTGLRKFSKNHHCKKGVCFCLFEERGALGDAGIPPI